MFVIFISTEKMSRLFRTIAKPDDKRPKAITPFVFPCPSAHENTKKDCNFLSFSRLLEFSLFCMIIECGACLGLKFSSTFWNYFPFSTRLQSQSFGCLFPSTNMNTQMKFQEKFSCCHIKEFSPKSKKFFCCSLQTFHIFPKFSERGWKFWGCN